MEVQIKKAPLSSLKASISRLKSMLYHIRWLSKIGSTYTLIEEVMIGTRDDSSP